MANHHYLRRRHDGRMSCSSGSAGGHCLDTPNDALGILLSVLATGCISTIIIGSSLYSAHLLPSFLSSRIASE